MTTAVAIQTAKGLMNNYILRTDAYKQTHWLQYPDGAERIFSYLESRGGEYDETVFFGLQYYLKEYLQGVVVTQEMIDQAEEIVNKTFMGQAFFNRKGWEKIVNTYGGKLPIRIRAVAEGTVVPVSNVLMTVETTVDDPDIIFIVGFVETMLMKLWYPITVATQSYKIKEIIRQYANLCGTQVNPFALNDFGYRGTSSEESAALGGAAHLVNFEGTDTTRGVLLAMSYYGAEVNGFSVMAAEHSTVTSYGKENEAKAYAKFMDACPTGYLSIVSDSYDYYNAVENIYGKELKEKILARDGKLVVRPDSGYPPEVCLKTLELLWEAFGGEINAKGYKVLNPKVGVIYGDGINAQMIREILETITKAGFSIDNVVFGMGGALLQQVNRDTCRFAFKCSAIKVDGEWRDVFKQPKTDDGKKSKRGKLDLCWNRYDETYVTRTPGKLENGDMPVMETVFENGEILKNYTFDEIRENTN